MAAGSVPRAKKKGYLGSLCVQFSVVGRGAWLKKKKGCERERRRSPGVGWVMSDEWWRLPVCI